MNQNYTDIFQISLQEQKCSLKITSSAISSGNKFFLSLIFIIIFFFTLTEVII